MSENDLNFIYVSNCNLNIILGHGNHKSGGPLTFGLPKRSYAQNRLVGMQMGQFEYSRHSNSSPSFNDKSAFPPFSPCKLA